MGFLDRLKSSQATGVPTWKTLSDISQLEQIAKDSEDKAVVIFKHSVTCGISAGAKHRLESQWDLVNTDIDFYYLDLLSNRTISSAIADRWAVRHQSPQIVVIRNNEAVYDTSHGSISPGDLESKVAVL
jgi:bacillithiol system protein YtxJ